MPLIIPPGFGSAAIVFQGSVGTPEFVTTIGVDLSAAAGDFVAAATNVVEGYIDAFAPITSPAITILRCELTVGQDGTGNGSVVSDTTPLPGQGAGDVGPVAMAVIAQKRTAILGRRGRGRMFLPGTASEGAITEAGTIRAQDVPAYQAAMDEFLAHLANGWLGGPATPAVLLHSSAPADPTPITALVPGPLVGWVRSRIN